MHTCSAAPDGRHCYHMTTSGPWYGVTPPPQRCCWCGQSPAAEHGPHYPGPNQFTVTWTGPSFGGANAIG